MTAPPLRGAADATRDVAAESAPVVARASGSTSFYRLALSSAGVGLESVESGAATVLGSPPLTVEAGASYTLGLAVSGTELTGSVNGAAVLSATAKVLSKGRIGLQTYAVTARFDDVSVTTVAAPTASPTKTTSPNATPTTSPNATPLTPPNATPSTSPNATPTTSPNATDRGSECD